MRTKRAPRTHEYDFPAPQTTKHTTERIVIATGIAITDLELRMCEAVSSCLGRDAVMDGATIPFAVLLHTRAMFYDLDVETSLGICGEPVHQSRVPTTKSPRSHSACPVPLHTLLSSVITLNRHSRLGNAGSRGRSSSCGP